MTSALNNKITFISAGAGSGKTHRLTEILHQELTSQQVRPSGVLATTFTKKAAAELRERVRGHLLDQGNFNLANAIGQAKIGTVNSICGQLLERFAFEAGMAVEQQVLEESQAAILLDKAIDGALPAAEMGPFLSLVNRLGLADKWTGELQSLVNQIRVNDIEANRIKGFGLTNAVDLLLHFPKPSTQDLSDQLQQAIAAAMPVIEKAVNTSGKKITANYLKFLKKFNDELLNKSTTWGDWVKLSKESPEAALKKQVEPIVDICSQVAAHPDLRQDITSYLEQIFDLASKALDIYAQNKRELGMLDFADQEHLLLKLLDNSSVTEVLADELDLLMVDEFQDTSPIQLALFLKLAQFAKKVYWVGDIKQAIYSFRGSDTALMQAIIEELPQLNATKEVLPFSWRSRPELVEIVNAVFSHAFKNGQTEDKVMLFPKREKILTEAALANWVLDGNNIKQEANALASGIKKLIENKYQIIEKGADTSRNVCFGDIAILSRTHSGIEVIADALRMQGIPSATAQPGLLSTPEATLALACLRRLNDPADTLATAEIVSLADSQEPEQWVADRFRHLQSESIQDEWLEIECADRKAHPLIAKLAALRRHTPLLAPCEALQTVIYTCDIPAKVIGWSSSPERSRLRLANLEALLNAASQYEDFCRSSLHTASISGLILWLGELAAEKKDMQAEPAIDAVKVMTHHAAKGLEWPVVVLMDLDGDIKDRLWSISAQPGANFDAQAPLKDRTLRYWPWPFGQQKNVAVANTIATTPIAQTFRNAAIEEQKRLLYVSMTRARDLLVLARSSRTLTGKWIKCVDAPWLLPDAESTDILLPNQTRLPADYWRLKALNEPAAAQTSQPAQYWFAPKDNASSYLPLNFNPSRAAINPAKVLEKYRIGERLTVKNDADMTRLGTAIHACLAVSFTDTTSFVSLHDVQRILAAFGVSTDVAAEAVLNQIIALHGWINHQWPNASAYAEYPVQSLMDSEQILSGRLDLLLSTNNGWVLIDHKSSQLAFEHWSKLATEHGAQLKAYETAIEQATGQKVRESWLFLPVAGGAIRLGG